MAEQKYAMVSGVASGLGFEFSKLLAADGYNLVIVDINRQKLESVKDIILREFKIEIRAIVIDLASLEAADELYLKVKEYQPEVVINNAGFGLGGYFAESNWNLEDRMIKLHVFTPTRFCKLIIKDMISAGRGRIMNVASFAAFTPGPLMAIYYSTKAYLLSFGRAVSNELKGIGVSLTTACPGLTKTGFSGTRATNTGVEPPVLGIMADSAEKVFRIAYRAMMKGKTLSVPVFKDRLMNFLIWLLPGFVIIGIVRKSQSKLNTPGKK